MDSSTTQFLNFLQRNALILEVTLLLLSLLSVSIYYFDIPGSSIILLRTVNLIAITYLFFASFDGKVYPVTNLGTRLRAIGFSVAILAALFKILDYPSREMMVKFGVFSLFMSMFIWGYYSIKNGNNQLAALLSRFSLCITAALVLWYL